jgi:uncharacterized protein (TIGR02147 family)
VDAVFGFEDYKAYLLARLDGKEGLGKGGRTRLCEAMGCQTAYFSQVLRGPAHLSLEQADALNRALGHGEDESEYFLLLVQQARAGTPGLRSFTRRLRERVHRRRERLKTRLGPVEELSLESQLKYYSAWHYAAVHVAATLPECHSVEAIARRLGLEPRTVASALEFLVGCGCVERVRGRYQAAKERIHLGDDSDLVSRYHINWRVRALQSIERNSPDDLHYTSVVTLSRSDVPRVREAWLRAIETVKGIVRPSPAESLRGVALDWFAL